MDDNEIQAFLEKIKPIIEENKQIRAKKAAKGKFFNIFSLLDVERDEVHTHSVMLAELLNPQGSHGMKDVFLRLFVEKMPIHNIKNKNELDTSTAIVKKEKYIGKVDLKNETGGEIDILIEFTHPHYAIVIENKIYAGDQEKQLARYKNYAEKYKNFTLLYLTLDGHEPSEWSIGKETGNRYWKCISYAEDIKGWLNDSILEISKNLPVCEIVKQYIGLINKLTDQNIQNMEDKMSAKLTKLMIDNLDETLAIVYDNKEQFDIKIYELFQKQMKSLASKIDCEFEDDKGRIWLEELSLIKFTFKKNPTLCVVFGYEEKNGCCYGLKNSKVKSKKKNLNCLSCINDKWDYGFERCKYKYWNSDTIRAIFNGELKEYIKNCITEIRDDPNFPKE